MGERCPFLTDTGVQTYALRDCITTDCKLYDTENRRCGMKISDVAIHEQNSHQHPLYHTCYNSSSHTGTNDEYQNGCGDVSLSFTMPYASILINEFLFNQDMDSNNKIYGFDFKINDDDAQKPPVLISLEDNPLWTDPSCVITWAQYLAWLSDSTANPYSIGLCEE